MRKLFLITGLFCWAQLAMGQYYMLNYSNAGRNPGGLNLEDEVPAALGLQGWTIIHEGGVNAPEWSDNEGMPFAFEFNGVNRAGYKVSTSGVLTFDLSSTDVPSGENEALPSSSVPDNSVVVWGLEAATNNDKILEKVFGTAPNRQLWIMFNAYEAAGSTLPICNFFWSIVLEESTNNIYIVDQKGSPLGTCAANLTLGLQLDAATAYTTGDSPSASNMAGASGGPEDNSYFAFIPGEQPANDMEAQSLDVEEYLTLDDAPIEISATFLNQGADELRSLDLYYSINGVAAGVDHLVSNLSTTSFTHDIPWIPTMPGQYEIEVWVDAPNGVADAIPGNNSISKTVYVTDKNPDHIALIESFTQHNCGPCAAQNPALHNVMQNNLLDASAVKWVVTWPGANNDPRHFFNSPDNITRRGYYGVNGVPTTIFAGTFDGQPGDISNAMVNTETNQPGLYDIQITESVSNGMINVSVDATPVRAITETNALVLQIAIIQDELHYDSPTGTNGERDFYDIMRYTLPNANGTSVSLENGVTTTVTGSRPVDPIFEESVMRVVVWVQDNSTQEIYMATKSPGMYFCDNGSVLDADYTVDKSSCGFSNGSATVSVTGGTAPYNYVWNSGEIVNNITNKPAGDYTVNITDAAGCNFSMPLRIEDKPGPRLILSPDDAACANEPTGGVRAYVAGGTAPYTYGWSNGSSATVLENIAPGGYGLTITDVDGCTVAEAAVVEQPAPLGAMAEAVGPDNGTDNGSATVSMVSGGVEPYTYEWQTSPVQTGATATGLSAGMVDVIIRDYNGCEITETVEIASNVGIEDLTAAGISALQAYPNPSRGVFTLDIQLAQVDMMKLAIYDMTGKVLYQFTTDRTLNFKEQIDLGAVAAGVYTLRIETSQGVGYERLSVE